MTNGGFCVFIAGCARRICVCNGR